MLINSTTTSTGQEGRDVSVCLQIRTQRNVGRLGDEVLQDPADDLEGQSGDGAAEEGPEEQHQEPGDLGEGGRCELVQEVLRDRPAVLAGVEGGAGAIRLPGVEGIPLDDHLAAGRHPGGGETSCSKRFGKEGNKKGVKRANPALLLQKQRRD